MSTYGVHLGTIIRGNLVIGRVGINLTETNIVMVLGVPKCAGLRNG